MSDDAQPKDEGISGASLKTIGQVLGIGVLIAGGAAQAAAIRSDVNNLTTMYRSDMAMLQRRLDKTEDLQSRLTVLEATVSRDRDDFRVNNNTVDRRLISIEEQLRRLSEEIQRLRRR